MKKSLWKLFFADFYQRNLQEMTLLRDRAQMFLCRRRITGDRIFNDTTKKIAASERNEFEIMKVSFWVLQNQNWKRGTEEHQKRFFTVRKAQYIAFFSYRSFARQDWNIHEQ